jgi:hypothetical protein
MQEYPHRAAPPDNDSRDDLGQEGSQLEFAPNLGVGPHARAGRYTARESAEFRWRCLRPAVGRGVSAAAPEPDYPAW